MWNFCDTAESAVSWYRSGAPVQKWPKVLKQLWSCRQKKKPVIALIVKVNALKNKWTPFSVTCCEQKQSTHNTPTSPQPGFSCFFFSVLQGRIKLSNWWFIFSWGAQFNQNLQQSDSCFPSINVGWLMNPSSLTHLVGISHFFILLNTPGDKWSEIMYITGLIIIIIPADVNISSSLWKRIASHSGEKFNFNSSSMEEKCISVKFKYICIMQNVS